MLSHHDKQKVINVLDDVLGPGTSMKNDEQAHYCPFVIIIRKSYK